MQSTAQILDKMDLTVFVTRCFVHSGTGLSRIGQQSLQVSRLSRPDRSVGSRAYRRGQHL